jgi:site-specific recombinase XerD
MSTTSKAPETGPVQETVGHGDLAVPEAMAEGRGAFRTGSGQYRRGRPPALPTPDVPMPAQWELDFASFVLHEKIAGKSERTIAVRRSCVSLLARWLADPVNGLHVSSPADVRRVHMEAYLAGQIDVSKFSGVLSVYSDLKVWWTWYAAEYEVASPMARIARPSSVRFAAAEVAVLNQEQFAALLKAASGKDPESRRDLALILLLATSGLRHNEARLLDVSDVDVSTHLVNVRRETAKFSKARQTVIGTEAALALTRWLRARAAIAPDGEAALFVTMPGRGNRGGHRISYDARRYRAQARRAGRDRAPAPAHAQALVDRHPAAQRNAGGRRDGHGRLDD